MCESKFSSLEAIKTKKKKVYAQRFDSGLRVSFAHELQKTYMLYAPITID